MHPSSLIGSAFFASAAVLAVWPIRRPWSFGVLSWALSAVPNELPLQFAVIVAVANIGALDMRSTGDAVSILLAVATLSALAIAAVRALPTRRVLDDALTGALGSRNGRPAPTSPQRCRRWLHIALAPLPLRPPRGVDVLKDLPYGPHGRDNTLDVYRHHATVGPAPVLIHLHAGHFRWGRKSHHARPLLHHLAAAGWVCVSANYRRSPSPNIGFPDFLVDVKRVIAWARTEGRSVGIDRSAVVVAGSSAGGYLAVMAALTQNDAQFQPGFEHIDTSIAAAIGCYGYYGTLSTGTQPSSDPLDYAADAAAPLLMIHGTNDTYVPLGGPRALLDHYRAASAPVVLAELPGAQHSFDLFHSIRNEDVINAIDEFATWACTRAHVATPLRTQRDSNDTGA